MALALIDLGRAALAFAVLFIIVATLSPPHEPGGDPFEDIELFEVPPTHHLSRSHDGDGVEFFLDPPGKLDPRGGRPPLFGDDGEVPREDVVDGQHRPEVDQHGFDDPLSAAQWSSTQGR